ncbi:MAG: DUF5915 domain-containing protein, partial [Candidatus Methanofastidiosia archaeon]
LSRWYVRLVRSRTWKEKEDMDKIAVYFTLHYALVKLSKLQAPLMPYMSEEIYQNLSREKDSVHLEDFPSADEKLIDINLEKEMTYVRKVMEASANARQRGEIKQRWPVSEVVVESDDPAAVKAIQDLECVLLEQINTKSIKVAKLERALEVKPNYKNLGPKFKGEAKKVSEAILGASQKELIESIKSTGKATVSGFDIDSDDILLEERLPEGWRATDTDFGKVFVNVKLNDALLSEAMARELIRRIQEMRKELDLKVEDMIKTHVACDFEDMVLAQKDHIANETRSKSFVFGSAESGYYKEWKIDKNVAKIWIEKE